MKNTQDSLASRNTVADKRFSQTTLLDTFKEAGAVRSHVVSSCDPSFPQNDKQNSPQTYPSITECEPILGICETCMALELQRSKFRPLSIHCYYLMNPDSCSLDSIAELPLHFYLLHDFVYKISQLSLSKQNLPQHGSSNLSCNTAKVRDLLKDIRPFIKNVRRFFETAISALQGGDKACHEHWIVESSTAGHPELTGLTVSNSSISASVFLETLSFICKVLSLPEAWTNKSFLLDLFGAFQPIPIPDSLLTGMHPSPLPGTIGYLYCGTYMFLEGVLDTVTSSSFKLALEVLLALRLIVDSSQKFLRDPLEGNWKHSDMSSILAVCTTLQKRLGALSCKLLRHDWDDSNLNQGRKSQGNGVEKILSTYIESTDSSLTTLDELASAVVSEISESKDSEKYHGFFTLRSATLHVWCRTLHEKNLLLLNELVNKARSLEKRKINAQPEVITELLVKFQQSVTIFVKLIRLCRTYDKVSVHAMAVKHGGKFVDTFLRAFDFLKAHFQQHCGVIVHLMTELQIATRTIQIICSEAKGSKQTVITSKIPATKRSMERFLFCVKALLHDSSSGCGITIGNLKHKDLHGQVVSSQIYVDNQYDTDTDPVNGALEVEEPCKSIGGEEEN